MEPRGDGAQKTRRWFGLGPMTVIAAMALAGCAPEIGGRASFPVLSKGTLGSYWEPIAQVNEKRCSHAILFIAGWGKDSNHEALVTDILAKHKGDAIIDADMTFFSVPAVFYNQQCARIRGTVVRRSGAPRGEAAPALQPKAGGDQ
jgi:hypothetical protein